MSKDGNGGPHKWREFQQETTRYNFPWGIVFRVMGIIAVLVVVVGALGFAFDWFGEGRRIVSPENVREQWRFAYDTVNDLEGIARQVCTARVAEANATNENTRTQRESQRLAYENGYFRLQQDFDARLEDKFRAGIVAPPDVPRTAPTLEQSIANVVKTGVACAGTSASTGNSTRTSP